MFVGMHSGSSIKGLLYGVTSDTSSQSSGLQMIPIWPCIPPPKSLCSNNALALILFKRS